MATARPVVSIYKYDEPQEKKGCVRMPECLYVPLRPDVCQMVVKDVQKNKRQVYAVKQKAGYETAAESWGTGRAVARVPRAPGGGTHRAGQGAFGNMCRGGGRFSPTQPWRRWHRRVNKSEKRLATASALAASCLPSLVMARGHRIGEVNELPIILTDGIEKMVRTRPSVIILEKLGLKEEMAKIIKSRGIRAGKGKMRNRRYKKRTGPLIVYKEDNGIVRAMRNIPGVETGCVSRLNILKLAPGGQFGRLLIWSESAFRFLKTMYGTFKSGAPLKHGFTLPRACMENPDLARIINSTEIQSVLRPKLEAPKAWPKRRNALKHKDVMRELNPYEPPKEDPKVVKARKEKRTAEKKEYRKKHKTGEDTWWKKQMRAFDPKPQAESAAEEEE